MGFFGVKFWSRDFLGVLIFAPFDHPCRMKSRVPPPLGVECWPGGCSWEFLVGVCCLVLQILKNPFFHTNFQTWPLKSIPFFRPGPQEIMSSLQTKKGFLKIRFEFAYLSFFLIHLAMELKRLICSYTPAVSSKTIPDSRPEWCKKPYSLGWHIPLYSLYKGVPPPPPLQGALSWNFFSFSTWSLKLKQEAILTFLLKCPGQHLKSLMVYPQLEFQ